MITVYIFRAPNNWYGFTLVNDASLLPQGYGQWVYVETRTYTLNDNPFKLAPHITTNIINEGIEADGYYVVEAGIEVRIQEND